MVAEGGVRADRRLLALVVAAVAVPLLFLVAVALLWRAAGDGRDRLPEGFPPPEGADVVFSVQTPTDHEVVWQVDDHPDAALGAYRERLVDAGYEVVDREDAGVAFTGPAGAGTATVEADTGDGTRLTVVLDRVPRADAAGDPRGGGPS